MIASNKQYLGPSTSKADLGDYEEIMSVKPH